VSTRNMDGQPDRIRITKKFVDYWSARFDEAFPTRYARDEQRLKTWFAKQKGPRFVDRRHFVDLAVWKTPRPRRYYEQNSSAFVRKVTEAAFRVGDGRLRLHTLMALHGVGVPVASTILHFVFPDRYPIMDVRVVAALRKAELWQRDDARSFTTAGWLEYIQLMRGLAKKLAVELRDLDKALWAFDKFGRKAEGGRST
jgi:hypothetical protein